MLQIPGIKHSQQPLQLARILNGVLQYHIHYHIQPSFVLQNNRTIPMKRQMNTHLQFPRRKWMYQVYGRGWLQYSLCPVSVSHLPHQILPESIACRFYVATVLIETAIDLAIEGELFLRVRQITRANSSSTSQNGLGEVASSKMPVYLSIFALAQWVMLPLFILCTYQPFIPNSVFQFVMAVGAVYARNTLQFLCLTYVTIQKKLSYCYSSSSILEFSMLSSFFML